MNKARIIKTVIFMAGIYYVLVFVLKGTSTWLDTRFFKPVTQGYSDILIVIQSMALGVGVVNVFKVHTHRIVRVRQHWEYSIVLLVGFLTVTVFGVLSWLGPERIGAGAAGLFSFVINRLTTHMNSTIYSFLAFFVTSAALRAFRIRGIESSIMMVGAVIVLLAVAPLTEVNIPHIAALQIWMLKAVQSSVFRALEFGVLLGGITVGLRMWLGIERSALFEET